MTLFKRYLFSKIIAALLIFQMQGQNMDSLKFAFKKASNDTSRCIILNSIIETEGDDNIWPVYNEELRKISETHISNSTGKIRNFYLKYYGAALNNIGFLANNYGDIPKALEYWHKSLKIQEEILDSAGMAASFNNLATVYNHQNDIKRAIEYHEKSRQIREAMSDRSGVAQSLNNVGTIYFDQKEYNRALRYFKNAVVIQEEMNDKRQLAASYHNLASVYHMLRDFDYALKYEEKALTIEEELKDKKAISHSLSSIAFVMQQKKLLGKALEYASNGLKMAQELDYPDNIGFSARVLKDIYQERQEYKKAYEMFGLQVKMEKKINNQENENEVVRKQVQYTYEKKEAIARAEHKMELEKQKVVADEKARRQQMITWSVIIGLFFVIAFAGYVFRSLKITRTQKKMIELKNQETEKQKQIIEHKQKEIIDSITYAKRIQTALMTNERYFNKNLNRLSKNN
jgi:tetratricopeptide (TPR) repeat protein